MVAYYTNKIPVTAVNGISFSMRKGECPGLAGESGWGKSTTAKMDSFDPRCTLGDGIMESMINSRIKKKEAKSRMFELLGKLHCGRRNAG